MKKMATLHELGIFRNRKPATDEYAVVVHSDDFVFRGNAGNAICWEKGTLLHVKPPKLRGIPLSSDANGVGRLAGWGARYYVKDESVIS